jgi:hypothetical protein
MADLPLVQWTELKAALQAEFDTALQSAMQSVNGAVAGELIAGSEEGVRDAVATLRTQIFQKALQLRVDAVEQQLAPPVDPLTSKKNATKDGSQRRS